MHFSCVYEAVKWPDQIPPEYVKRIVVYADGSCWNVTREGAYAARLAYYLSEESLIAKHYVWNSLDDVTNNIAELKAIYHGLAAIPQQIKDVGVTVYSDSEWAVRCLDGRNNPVMYHDHPVITWSMIHGEAARFRSVKYVHTKGHAGTLGNEECDTLCEYARKKIPITEKVFNELMVIARKKSNA